MNTPQRIIHNIVGVAYRAWWLTLFTLGMIGSVLKGR